VQVCLYFCPPHRTADPHLPLYQLRDALLTAMDKKGSGSIKVAFRY
jgi:hypothetical protein